MKLGSFRNCVHVMVWHGSGRPHRSTKTKLQSLSIAKKWPISQLFRACFAPSHLETSQNPVLLRNPPRKELRNHGLFASSSPGLLILFFHGPTDVDCSWMMWEDVPKNYHLVVSPCWFDGFYCPIPMFSGSVPSWDMCWLSSPWLGVPHRRSLLRGWFRNGTSTGTPHRKYKKKTGKR